MHWFRVGKLTFIEVFQGRLYQILLFSTLIAPLFGAILSTLFMMDIGKVYMDGVMGIVHFTSVVFTLFITVSLLARDIEQKVCYLLVVQPSSRDSYLLGRFFGFLLAYAFMVFLLIIESIAIGELIFSDKASIYAAGYSWFNMGLLITLHAFQYVAVLGLVFFIVSWATGLAEILFFSTIGLLLSWMFPQILIVVSQMTNVDDSSELLYQVFVLIYNVLPQINGATISRSLTHDAGILTALDAFTYTIEHIAYAGVSLGLAVWIFKKRNL